MSLMNARFKRSDLGFWASEKLIYLIYAETAIDLEMNGNHAETKLREDKDLSTCVLVRVYVTVQVT